MPSICIKVGMILVSAFLCYPKRTWLRLHFSYYNFATFCSILCITFILEAELNVGMRKGRHYASSRQTAGRTGVEDLA